MIVPKDEKWLKARQSLDEFAQDVGRQMPAAPTKAATREKMLERARRTGRKTTLSRLSTKAAATKPFLGVS